MDPNESTPPTSFGYKNGWYAVRSRDKAAVAEAIGLDDQLSASWRDGIEAAYDDKVFITPPVGEWTAIVGRIFIFGEEHNWDERLKSLSETFNTAMYFSTYRVSECHEWAKAESGNIIRAFIHADGETEFEKGPVTPAEIELGFGVPDPYEDWDSVDGEPIWFPDEDFVMQLAGRWCFNPQDLEEHPEMSVAEPGLIGVLTGESLIPQYKPSQSLISRLFRRRS